MENKMIKEKIYYVCDICDFATSTKIATCPACINSGKPIISYKQYPNTTDGKYRNIISETKFKKSTEKNTHW
jgi:hypothetical protein